MLENFIKVRLNSLENYNQESLCLVWASREEGIQAIVGKEGEKTTVQSYLFDKEKWTLESINKWFDKKNNQAKASAHKHNNKCFVNAKAVLCDRMANLNMGKADISPLTTAAYDAQAGLNDKYYLYVESVYEGTNLNYDHFSREELIKAYPSMSYQPIDWEHYREEIIGFSLESKLVTQPEGPLSIGFNGVLNRLSPYLLIDGRDEIIRQRWFEGRLAMSMECYFNEMECLECGFRTNDMLDFEHHIYTLHLDMVNRGTRPARKLIDIDFVGNGIVEYPAEPQAEIKSLRTDENALLEKEIFTESAEAKIIDNLPALGPINMVVASFKPDAIVNNEKIELFEEIFIKNEENSTKNEENNDIVKEQEINPNSSILGGTSMFELSKKVAEAKTFSDIFVIAQTVLNEYLTENKLDEASAKAFSDELAEVVNTTISKEDFKVSEIYTLSTEAHEKEITEKTADYENRLSQTEERIKKLNEEKAAIETEKADAQSKLVSAEEKIASMVEDEKKRNTEAKLNSFIETVKNAGVALTETMEKTLRTVASTCLEDETALAAIREDLVAVIKQSNLSEASQQMGSVSVGSDNGPKDLSGRFKEINEKYKTL